MFPALQVEYDLEEVLWDCKFHPTKELIACCGKKIHLIDSEKETKIGEHELYVIADCFVATPTQFSKPKHPYFFLQEYKKGRGDSKDPECQMLMAMLIAQQLNQDNQPLYGSYLFGSRWRFTTLVGNQYCISKEFDADEEADLLAIIFILRKLKELILNRW